MITKKAVWNWFAQNNKLLDSSNKHEYNVKLQKLLFIASGLYQTFYEKPLCNTNFEAWTEGPVDNEVYAQIKNNDILVNTYTIDAQIVDFLKKINNVFGIYSSFALSEMTHSFASWKDAYKEDNGVPIPHIKMDKTKIANDFEILKSNFENFHDYNDSYYPLIINDVTVLYNKKIDYDIIHQNYNELKSICNKMRSENEYLIFVEEDHQGGVSYEI